MNADHGVHISVIIPYHRADDSLYKSVRSVFLQTYRPYEIILVSDGCGTAFDLEQLPKTTIKIKIIRLKTNLGPANARNIGMNEAEGNFISFLDSDDFWRPNKLLNQVKIIREQSEQTCIFTVSPVIIIENEKESHTRFPLLDSSEIGREKLFAAPYLYLGSTALFSTKVLKEIGFQNTKLRIYEDFEWQLRIACKHNINILSSKSADVFINKNKKIFSEKKLDENYKELVSSISKNPKFPKKCLKYLSSVHLVNVARNYLYKGNYIYFVVYLLASFFKCPRITLHNEKLWNISYKK